jgi:epoxyqueuosine reductase
MALVAFGRDRRKEYLIYIILGKTLYMIELLRQEALEHGDKLQIIPIDRLPSIKKEIEAFREQEDLNGFQKWIVNNLYTFDVPTAGFTTRSIILIAIPHPAYAQVEFTRQGKKYSLVSLVMSDLDNAEKYLSDFLAPKDYHIKSAPNLPLKRLAVKSGLAVYGRNNICYIEEMGSFFSFAAYYSDIPCDNAEWAEMRTADPCTHCRACFNNCPTGAIRDDRFLIDNERCLSYFNESAGDFPEWLPISVHHCLYDCLKCQIGCPMNKEYVNHVIGPIEFSENETDMLLSGSPFDTFSLDLKQKSITLGLHQWLDAIPRNLKILLESSDRT